MGERAEPSGETEIAGDEVEPAPGHRPVPDAIESPAAGQLAAAAGAASGGVGTAIDELRSEALAGLAAEVRRLSAELREARRVAAESERRATGADSARAGAELRLAAALDTARDAELRLARAEIRAAAAIEAAAEHAADEIERARKRRRR